MNGGYRVIRRYTHAVPLLLVLLLAVHALPGPLQGPVAWADVQSEPLPPGIIAEPFVSNAGGFVVAMTFAPDGRLFYTTKGGFHGDQLATVRIVEHSKLRSTPFLSTLVNTDGERGLLGITLDPDFAHNRYVYIYKTAPASETQTGRPSNRVVRYTENPATQTAIANSAKVLFDLPIGPENDPYTVHNGGNLYFGPDGMLYVTIGDYGPNIANSQSLTNAMGKIHRFNPDGSIPNDNPFASSPEAASRSIWAYGLRNAFDFTFDPLSGRLFASENGPYCDDEINIIDAGGNYGWPHLCGAFPEDAAAPIYHYQVPVSVTGIDFYQGPIVEWNNELFWCAFTTGLLYHAELDASRTRVTRVRVVNDAPPCHVDLQHGPDGALYLSSNTTISRLRLGTAPQGQSRCFVETGQCISGRFQDYWEQQGGLPVFGFPVSPARYELNRDTGKVVLTQWFERNRFELHSPNSPPYDVLLGRLGDDRLLQAGINWQEVEREAGPLPGCLWFEETGRNLCDQEPGRGFKSYWLAHGLQDPTLDPSSQSLALFGLPLTSPTLERNSSGDVVLTQWFERARLEWHPDKPEQYRVLLGLLGRELREEAAVHRRSE